MPRNICLAFGRFGSLFLLTSSVSADGVVCLVILSGCCSSSSLAIPMASTVVGRSRRQRPSSTRRFPVSPPEVHAHGPEPPGEVGGQSLPILGPPIHDRLHSLHGHQAAGNHFVKNRKKFSDLFLTINYLDHDW